MIQIATLTTINRMHKIQKEYFKKKKLFIKLLDLN